MLCVRIDGIVNRFLHICWPDVSELDLFATDDDDAWQAGIETLDFDACKYSLRVGGSFLGTCICVLMIAEGFILPIS